MEEIEYINRRDSNCYKWDSEHAASNLPLWVADMDFKVAPAIMQAMQRRLEHGVFGYGIVPNDYYEAVSSWFARRHGWKGIKKENCIATIGIVPAISAILRALNDKKGSTCRVSTFTPAYNCFFSSINNLGCELIDCPLLCIDNHFEIDWALLEKQIESTDVLLLCNPHNPTGRVWTENELNKLSELCEQNKVFVISDEIHCDFTFETYHYTPYALVAKTNQYCICTSASKAFNIAGLQCANIYVPNPEMYALIEHAINVHEVCDLNPFGIVATIAAYNESEQWIDSLNQYVYDNYCYVSSFIQNRLPMLSLTRSEGTYLAWVNVQALGIESEQFCEQLKERERLLINGSAIYGAKGYVRINLATCKDNVAMAMNKIEHFISQMQLTK